MKIHTNDFKNNIKTMGREIDVKNKLRRCYINK